MRIKVFSLFLLIFFLFSCQTINKKNTELKFTPIQEEIKSRVESIYQDLMSKEFTNIYTRPILEDYFLTQDDLSKFITNLVFQIRETRIKENRFKGFRIDEINVNESGEVAEVYISLKGKYMIFINRNLLHRDEWHKINGQWYIFPPSRIESVEEMKERK